MTLGAVVFGRGVYKPAPRWCDATKALRFMIFVRHD